MEDQRASVHGEEPGVGSSSAWFEEDHARIFRYIMSMVRDTAEAEDLTQESLVRAHLHRNTLLAEGARTAWLYRIATHVSLDRLRQSARRGRRESDVDPEEVDIPEPNVPSLQKASEQEEMSECVQDYIGRLPDAYRAVIMLHDMHEVSATEMADILGVSLATIKIRLHRARVKLRAALGSGCDFSYDESNVLTCESKD